MKKFIIFSLFFVGVSGSFIFQQQTLNHSNEELVVYEQMEEAEEKLYQYSKPWDKDLYDSFFVRGEETVPESTKQVKGAIIPHHLLAGHNIASFFLYLQKQKPKNIILISPNHFMTGGGEIVATERDWKTIYGEVETDRRFLRKLYKEIPLHINESAIEGEHGIHSLIPFIAKTLPDTKVTSFMLKETASAETLNNFADVLAEHADEDTIFLSSIDFSHYQTPAVGAFHDEVSRNVIKSFDFDRLDMLEIDSKASLRVFLSLMEDFGSEEVFAEHRSNSGDLTVTYADRDHTTHYVAYFGEGQRSQEKAVSLLHFGDIMLDRGVARYMEKEGGLDYILKDLSGEEDRFFTGVDVITANLEGPFVQNRVYTSKEIAFRFDPALAKDLKRYNFDLVTLANNHSLDMGSKAFEESKKHLENADIEYYGRQFYVDEEDSILLKEIAGKKVAFIGLNDTHFTMNEKLARKMIEKSKNDNDITIVSIHWGQEYKQLSNNRQKKLAHDFIDAGADAVIGHHPHVVEECEVYEGKPICYSLGNFIFDQWFSKETQTGLALGLIMYPEKISIYIFPLVGEKSKVDFMPWSERKGYLDKFFEMSGVDGDVKKGRFRIGN